MKHIFKCSSCGRYTMKETCDCGSNTIAPKPLKFTPDDKLSKYRRKAKLDEYANRGLI